MPPNNREEMIMDVATIRPLETAGGKIAEYYTGMKKVTLSMSPTRVKVRASADHRVLYPDHVF